MGEEANVVDKWKLNYLQDYAGRSLQGIDQVNELTRAIFRLTPELQANPDAEAHKKLVEAIGEVAKTWEAINEAIKTVWQLYGETGDLKMESGRLWDLGSGEMPALVDQKRGHCHRIGDIYWRNLNGWFSQTLTPADQDIMGRGFAHLGEADDDLFCFMVRVAAGIDNVAGQVLDLIEDEQPDAARTIAKGLRRELRPLQRAINESLTDLRRVQTEFAGILPPEKPQPTIIVEGDYIEVGDITNATGIAIGRDAHAEVSE